MRLEGTRGRRGSALPDLRQKAGFDQDREIIQRPSHDGRSTRPAQRTGRESAGRRPVSDRKRRNEAGAAAHDVKKRMKLNSNSVIDSGAPRAGSRSQCVPRQVSGKMFEFRPRPAGGQENPCKKGNPPSKKEGGPEIFPACAVKNRFFEP